ncbi:MAG: choice-of-anchor L domain-containing protein, partial [Myxococcota bacterium]
VTPFEGERLLLLSSGTARRPGDRDHESPAGFDKGYRSPFPEGSAVTAPACPEVTTGATYDDIALDVVLRPPPGAEGLSFDFVFFTYEWPEYVCSIFNDFFLALLDPPPDGQGSANISFDRQENPVSVNTALVDACSCAGGPPCPGPPPPAPPRIQFECPEGDDLLEDTGYETRAATGRLRTMVPVTTDSEGLVRLRLAVFDSGDPVLDSLVVLDNFRWLGEGNLEGPITEPR